VAKHCVEFEQWVPAAIERTFLFFANPANLPRIMPRWTRTELLRVKLVPPPGIRFGQSTVTKETPLAGVGSEIVTRSRIVPLLPITAKWIALITAFEWNHYFQDVQKQGPFKSFVHRHEMRIETCDGVVGTVVRDRIEYEIGFGILGETANALFVKRQFESMFRHRQTAVAALLK
jgi:ligand-binding SRPBCC domain-containing protein